MSCPCCPHCRQADMSERAQYSMNQAQNQGRMYEAQRSVLEDMAAIRAQQQATNQGMALQAQQQAHLGACRCRKPEE